MKTAYFNRFSIDLPEQCILDCSSPGQDASESVAYWLPQITLELDEEKLRAELKEYGAWDNEALADHSANLERILWSAACNLREELTLEWRAAMSEESFEELCDESFEYWLRSH